MKKIHDLFIRYKELILYVFFGGLTTLVNFAAFKFFNVVLGEEHYLVSNIIAWFVSVVFAYITNKLFVFESHTWQTKKICKEVLSFFAARVFSLVIEEAGLFCSTIDNYSLGQAEYYRKICEYEYNNGGRDYRTGIKIPQFMQELGLNNVGIRMNDSVKFVSPTMEEYEEKRKIFAQSKGYYEVLENAEGVSPLVSVLTKEEQEQFFENQRKIASAVVCGNGYLIQAPCVLISYGWK